MSLTIIVLLNWSSAISSLYNFLFFQPTETSSACFVSMYLFRIICSLLWTLVFCFTATKTVDQISAIGEVTYNSNWYDYSITQQKHIITIMARTQRATYFTGMQLFRCNLATFRQVWVWNTYYWNNINWATFFDKNAFSL